MEIKEYLNFKKAIAAICDKDKDYIFLKHTLKAGEEIKSHYHRKANEWIVVDDGEFKVKQEEKERTCTPKDQILIVHFPPGKRHSLLALSALSYFVFRDAKDTTIYC